MFRVVILGHKKMLTNLISGVVDANCNIVGVFRYENINMHFVYRAIKDFLFPSVEYNYIKSYNLNEIKSKSANSSAFKEELLKLNPDIVIVGTWSEKLKKEIIQIPKIATINVHPSLLPKYRGPNPYLRTIWNGEEYSGITFHLMSEDFDAGPILLQEQVEIKPDDTGEDLRERTCISVKNAITKLLTQMKDDFIIPVEQNEAKATYYPQITSDDVMLDFTKSSTEIYNHIRAFYPWTKTYFAHKDVFFYPNPHYVKILDNDSQETKCGLIVDKNAKEKSITVACGDGKLLKMGKLGIYNKFLNIFTRLYIHNNVNKSDLIN